MKTSIGFIGCGNMASAIIKSLQKSNNYKINIFDPDATKTAEFSQCASVYESCNKMVFDSDIVFIAVKPQVASSALNGLDFTEKIAVSVMASITINTIKAFTNNTTNKIVRIMSNLNARFNKAFTGFCHEGLSETELSEIIAILDCLGEFACVDESKMNAITAIAGSGPAFVYKFIKALTDAGVNLGLEYFDSLNMAITTISGSLDSIKSTDSPNLDKMISAVCSKGGTTLAGIDVLDRFEFENVVRKCVDSATNRAEEISKENERSNNLY